MGLLALWCAAGARSFALDASSDSLILEGDLDLRLAQEVAERYGGSDTLIVTFSPTEELLSEATLAHLAALRDELVALPGVSSVTSLLDVPLLRNPPVPLSELRQNLKTLEDDGTDLELARRELQSSPLYQELIVSPDLGATALQVELVVDAEHAELDRAIRSLVARKTEAGQLPEAEVEELARLRAEYSRSKDVQQARLHETVLSVRAVLDRHRKNAELFLGGVPMIVDDIIAYIRSDIVVFGLVVLALLGTTLGLAFRRVRWVVLPLVCCLDSSLTMVGLLGHFDWPVTVVSSNFISLQLIFTLSLAIHQIVRCEELRHSGPGLGQRALVLETVRHTFVPCFYASITTIAGFSSLALCDILPVSSFGWMMTMGVAISLVLTFLLMPAALMLLEPLPVTRREERRPMLPALLANLTERRRTVILVASLGVAVLTGVGVSRLRVENSFIDYFKKDSEIYQGMEFIDRELGGTTPLEVVLDFPDAAPEPVGEPSGDPDFDDFDEWDEPDEFDDFGDFDEFDEFGDADAESAGDEATYWFTTTKLERVGRVHRYLEAQPETGKVMSLETLARLGREINEGQPLDDLLLAVLFRQMPDSVRDVLVDPYASVEHNQARVNVRIRDSLDDLQRDAFLERVESELAVELGPADPGHHVTGLMVLYNNMLQSLFEAQVSTISYTIGALLFMFLLLFRSFPLAVIAVLPSLLSSMVVLGLMGWADIPLDVMTITIVAISTGIAVDDTIHYLHRFKRELQRYGNYMDAMHRAHRSIGSAMYFTTQAIALGFSVLALSSFVPSILFGLLTALAMVIALVSSLTMLPSLVLAVKPFGDPEAA